MSSYLCNARTKPHKFCKICGTSLMIDFEGSEPFSRADEARDILAVNVRFSFPLWCDEE